MQVLPLLDGPVGGGPHGFADESVKLAAKSAETIVDLIIVVGSHLSGVKRADSRGKLGDCHRSRIAGLSRERARRVLKCGEQTEDAKELNEKQRQTRK